MKAVTHRTRDELDARIEELRATPRETGRVELIVRRPAIGEREVIDIAELTEAEGLVGDNWKAKGSRFSEDGAAEVNKQITVMNVRAVAALTPEKSDWPLAGDQFYVDFDLSEENAPPGTHLRIGDATIEVSVEPHNGCHKFADRFGMDAVRFVNSIDGKALHLRGINARVVVPGTVRVGDTITKI